MSPAPGGSRVEELLPFNEPEYVADPYPFWERLRDERPVYWSETNRFWAVTRYDDVVEVLHDPARFSSGTNLVGASDESANPRLPMIQDDPPHHDRLRRILSRAFTPRTISEREGRVHELARGLVDELRARVAAGEESDLVPAFASPIICD